MNKRSSRRSNRAPRVTRNVVKRASSISKSRISEVSRAIQEMYQESKSDEQIMDIDMRDLIGQMRKLLQLYQGKTGETSESHPELSHRFWPSVKRKFSNIMNRVNHSGILIVVKDVAKVALSIFDRIKNSNEVLTTACLIVSYILDGFQSVSDNKEECLGLLDQVIRLAEHVVFLEFQRVSLNETKIDTSIKTSIKTSISVILEVSISCCTQMKACKIAKFFKATVSKEELSNLRRKVDNEATHIHIVMSKLHHLNENYYTRVPKVDIYPHDAVGIEETKKQILQLLEKSPVTVVVHGIGGMGKSTLANAVYSEFSDKKICKCIRVVVDTNPLPESIKVLQKNMIQDLMGADKPLQDFTSLEDGRLLLAAILQRQEAFIYIDNVSEEGILRQFLPSQFKLKKVSKLRLLITTRDRSIDVVLPKEGLYYHKMKPINSQKAMELVRKEMGGEEIKSTVLEEIIKKCNGVPLFLKLRAEPLAKAADKEKAYEIVREESNNCGGTGPQFGGKGVAELIGYNHLRDNLKDAFLDICSYFKGHDWHKVEDIVGIGILDQLEKKDLVTKDANSVTVDAVLLELGTHMSKATRIKGAREISRCLNAERDKDSQPIKGLWFSQDKDSKDTDPIPAKKLEPVSSFLRVLNLKSSFLADYDSEITFPKLIYLRAAANRLRFKVCLFEELKYLSYSPRNPEELNLKMPSSLRRLRLNGVFYRLEYEDCPVKLEWLQNLRSLTLCNFKQLQKLPIELSSITHLKFLKITGCANLEELPESLGEMKELRSLVVVNCPKLQKLPNSISKNTSLTCLKLHCRNRLGKLPKDFGSLTCLEELDLKGTRLENLPQNFSQLKRLKKLNLSRSSKLQDLCTNFEGLGALEYLTLSSCPMLKAEWMVVIGKMKEKNLKDVNITGSKMLLEKRRKMECLNLTRGLQLKKGNV